METNFSYFKKPGMDIKVDMNQETAGDQCLALLKDGYVPNNSYDVSREEYQERFIQLSKAVNPKPEKNDQADQTEKDDQHV